MVYMVDDGKRSCIRVYILYVIRIFICENTILDKNEGTYTEGEKGRHPVTTACMLVQKKIAELG